MKRALAIALGLLLAAASAQAASYSQPITFSGYGRSETLTNFPALVTFTNYNGFLSSSGYDLRFWTNSAASGTPLNYEISSWTNSGTSFVWVQVPVLTSNTVIYATWGNPAYNSQAAYTTNGAVWTNMYAAVWHMGQATNPIDSCRFPNDHSIAGGQYGSLTNTFLGYGLSYANYGLAPIQNPTDVSTQFTCSFWYFPRTFGGNTYGGTGYGTIFGNDGGSGGSPDGFRHRATPYLIYRNNTQDMLNSPITEYNAWHYFSFNGIYPGSVKPTLITDGSTLTTAALAISLPFTPLTLVSGEEDVSRCIDGVLTEMRLSTKIMTTNWVYADYMNMASNAVFNSYGAIVTPSGTAAIDTTPLLLFFVQ